MTAPRSVFVSLRAFLCGEDQFSGMNFDRRLGWIREGQVGYIKAQEPKSLYTIFGVTRPEKPR